MNIMIEKLLRDNIAGLTPYSSARDEFSDDADIFLDANESPYDNGNNRYPDPRQTELKSLLANMEGIAPEALFLGNGSDEAIDILIRMFCRPGIDNVVAMKPSYGMYGVAAAINGVKLKEVSLLDNFDLDAEELLAAVDPLTRVIFLCSPNNPTGNSIPRNQILRIARTVNAIVVVDEAYIHYSDRRSMADAIKEYNNIVVLRTLSKARGMASLRIGMAIADPRLTEWMSRVKHPYNISGASISEAVRQLGGDGQDTIERQIKETIRERSILAAELAASSCILKVYPSEANFLLVKTADAGALYTALISQGIIVRDRSKIPGCEGCLRITVGTPRQNRILMNAIRKYENEKASYNRP